MKPVNGDEEALRAELAALARALAETFAMLSEDAMVASAYDMNRGSPCAS